MVRGGDRASSTEFGLDRDHGFRADSASVARRSRDYLARRAQSRGSFRELRAPNGGGGTTTPFRGKARGPLSPPYPEPKPKRHPRRQPSHTTTPPHPSPTFP